jgi:hypothetical protein
VTQRGDRGPPSHLSLRKGDFKPVHSLVRSANVPLRD